MHYPISLHVTQDLLIIINVLEILSFYDTLNISWITIMEIILIAFLNKEN